MPLKDIENRYRVTLRNEGQTCWLNASLVILIHTDYYDHYLQSVDIEKLEHQEVKVFFTRLIALINNGRMVTKNQMLNRNILSNFIAAFEGCEKFVQLSGGIFKVRHPEGDQPGTFFTVMRKLLDGGIGSDVEVLKAFEPVSLKMGYVANDQLRTLITKSDGVVTQQMMQINVKGEKGRAHQLMDLFLDASDLEQGTRVDGIESDVLMSYVLINDRAPKKIALDISSISGIAPEIEKDEIQFIVWRDGQYYSVRYMIEAEAIHAGYSSRGTSKKHYVAKTYFDREAMVDKNCHDDSTLTKKDYSCSSFMILVRNDLIQEQELSQEEMRARLGMDSRQVAPSLSSESSEAVESSVDTILGDTPKVSPDMSADRMSEGRDSVDTILDETPKVSPDMSAVQMSEGGDAENDLSSDALSTGRSSVASDSLELWHGDHSLSAAEGSDLEDIDQDISIGDDLDCLIKEAFSTGIEDQNLDDYLGGTLLEHAENYSGSDDIMHNAILNNDVAVVSAWCDKGYNLLGLYQKKKYPYIHMMVRAGCLEMLKAFYKYKLPMGELSDPNDILPIHYAVMHGKHDIVDWLLSISINSNFLTISGDSLAHLAVENKDITMLTLLKNHKVSLQTINPTTGLQPVEMAMASGSSELLDFFYDSNLLDSHLAEKNIVRLQSFSLLRFLFNKGLDFSFIDRSDDCSNRQFMRFLMAQYHLSREGANAEENIFRINNPIFKEMIEVTVKYYNFYPERWLDKVFDEIHAIHMKNRTPINNHLYLFIMEYLFLRAQENGDTRGASMYLKKYIKKAPYLFPRSILDFINIALTHNQADFIIEVCDVFKQAFEDSKNTTLLPVYNNETLGHKLVAARMYSVLNYLLEIHGIKCLKIPNASNLTVLNMLSRASNDQAEKETLFLSLLDQKAFLLLECILYDNFSLYMPNSALHSLVARHLSQCGQQDMLRRLDATTGNIFNMIANGNIDGLKFLVDKGFDFLNFSQSSLSCLFHAAQYGKVAVIEFFKKQGLSVVVVDQNNNSLMHVAAEYGHSELIRWLALYPCLLIAENDKHETPLSIAKRYKKNDAEALIRGLIDNPVYGKRSAGIFMQEDSASKRPFFGDQLVRVDDSLDESIIESFLSV